MGVAGQLVTQSVQTNTKLSTPVYGKGSGVRPKVQDRGDQAWNRAKRHMLHSRLSNGTETGLGVSASRETASNSLPISPGSEGWEKRFTPQLWEKNKSKCSTELRIRKALVLPLGQGGQSAGLPSQAPHLTQAQWPPNQYPHLRPTAAVWVWGPPRELRSPLSPPLGCLGCGTPATTTSISIPLLRGHRSCAVSDQRLCPLLPSGDLGSWPYVPARAGVSAGTGPQAGLIL